MFETVYELTYRYSSMYRLVGFSKDHEVGEAISCFICPFIADGGFVLAVRIIKVVAFGFYHDGNAIIEDYDKVRIGIDTILC